MSTENYFGYDPDALHQLLKRINVNGDLKDLSIPRPLVTLEEFFEGNFDHRSIGFNLNPPASPREFYDLFRSIRERPEVYDVLVEVIGHEEPEAWPWSDTIWIITSAKPDVVKHWTGERLHPDDVIIGFESDVRKVEDYSYPQGLTAIGIWWD